jgi:hypothetical protein
MNAFYSRTSPTDNSPGGAVSLIIVIFRVVLIFALVEDCQLCN